MTSRSGNYALNQTVNDSSMYSNNRRNNWTYDDDGRVKISPDPTSGGTRNWTHDVAGNATFVSENVSGVTATNTLVYDGDDALLKDTVVNNSSTSSNYLISSTVLGKVLTKLDASGNKEITYVPLNHLRTALEQKDFQGNPTIGWVARDASGLQENDRAADPFGNLINNVQPPVVGPPPNIPFYGPGYMNPSNASFTNANNYAMSCVLDGITAPCGQVMRAVNNGTVNLNTLGLSTTGGLADFGNAGLGGLVIDLSNQQRIWKSDKVAPLAPPKLGTYTPGPARTSLSEDPRGGEASGHWEYFYELSAFFLEPQNPPFDVSGITKQANDILAKQACIDFANRILNAVSTKDNPVLRGGDLQQLFKDFLAQKHGGYTRVKPPGSAGYGSPTGLIRKGNGKIFSRGYPSMSAAEQTAYDAATTVAELFHMAGRNDYYTDRALAEAAHNIPEYAALYRGFNPQWNVFDPRYVDKAGAAKDPGHGGWSSYFHDIQRQLCGP